MNEMKVDQFAKASEFVSHSVINLNGCPDHLFIFVWYSARGGPHQWVQEQSNHRLLFNDTFSDESVKYLTLKEFQQHSGYIPVV